MYMYIVHTCTPTNADALASEFPDIIRLQAWHCLWPITELYFLCDPKITLFHTMECPKRADRINVIALKRTGRQGSWL